MNLKGIIIPDYIKNRNSIYKIDEKSLKYSNPFRKEHITLREYLDEVLLSVRFSTHESYYTSATKEEYNEQMNLLKQQKINFNEKEIENLEQRIESLKKEIDELKE